MKGLLKDIFGVITRNLWFDVEKVRRLIKNAIYNNTLIPQSRIPSYRETAHYLGINESVTQKAWLLLKEEDGIIITKAGGGTYVASEACINSNRLAEKNHSKKIKESKKEILFNQETVLYYDPVSKPLNLAWKKAVTKNEGLKSEQRKVRFYPGLITGLLKSLKPKLGIDLEKQELYYSQDYQYTLNRVCSVLFQRRCSNVMLGPVNELVRKTIRDVDKKVEWITGRNFDEELNLLAQHCSTKKVGFVYLSARVSCPFKDLLSKRKIMDLLALQRKFKFVLVNDDRYSALYPHTTDILLKSAFEMKADLIHLMPLTSFHSILNEIELIVGPALLIARLRRKFRAAGKSISAVTALSLKEILKNQELLRHEKIVLKKLTALMRLAGHVFHESGLWKAEGLFLTEGWFIYLEPVNGQLPDDIIDSLAKENISVMDLSSSLNDQGKVSVICLSMAAHIGNRNVKNDIITFNNVCKNLI